MAKTLAEAKNEVSEMRTKFTETNGFKPVFVKTEYKKNKFSFGVQFWSEFLINQGFSRNSDGTIAKFIEAV